jgi:ribosomal protein S18 acetylase RimI-like enzyme
MVPQEIKELDLDNLSLQPMTKEEFDSYLVQLRDRFIEEGVITYRATEAEIKKIVDMELNEINEYEAKNSHPFMISSENVKNIGSLWLFFRGEGEKQTPYLADVIINPDFRRQGIGKKALSLLEAELKSRGIKNNIAVHVVGDLNAAAVALFRSKGYFVTAILMEKCNYNR